MDQETPGMAGHPHTARKKRPFKGFAHITYDETLDGITPEEEEGEEERPFRRLDLEALVACHEAARAVLWILHGIRVEAMSIEPCCEIGFTPDFGQDVGYTEIDESKPVNALYYTYGAIAGPLASELFTGKHLSDEQHAYMNRVKRRLLDEYLADEYLAAGGATLGAGTSKEIEEYVVEMLQRYSLLVKGLAYKLLNHKNMTWDQISPYLGSALGFHDVIKSSRARGKRPKPKSQG